MNIKNRIKKFESQMGTASSFCECKNTPKIETVYHENGRPATSPGLLYQNSETVPERCPQCAKLINKTTIVVNFTDQKAVR